MFWRHLTLQHALTQTSKLSKFDPRYSHYKAIVDQEYQASRQAEDQFLKQWKLGRRFLILGEVEKLYQVMCQLLNVSPPHHLEHNVKWKQGGGSYSPITDTIYLSDMELTVIVHELAHHICFRELRGLSFLKSCWEEIILGTSHGNIFVEQTQVMFDLLVKLQDQALEKLPDDFARYMLGNKLTALTLLQGELKKREVAAAWKKTKQEIGL